MLKKHISQKNNYQTSQKHHLFLVFYIFFALSNFKILGCIFYICFVPFFPKIHGKIIPKIKINEPNRIRLSAIL